LAAHNWSRALKRCPDLSSTSPCSAALCGSPPQSIVACSNGHVLSVTVWGVAPPHTGSSVALHFIEARRYERASASLSFVYRMHVHCASHIATPLEQRKTTKRKNAFAAGTSLTPPSISHRPTASPTPIKNKKKQDNVETGGPSWAPSTGLEKVCALAHNTLELAVGLVLGHVLLDLDSLVSCAVGSGGVTVGTTLDGAAGLVLLLCW